MTPVLDTVTEQEPISEYAKEEDDTSDYDETARRIARNQAHTLDPDNLPRDIVRMAGLCDALNMACVEQRSPYGIKDSDLIWHSVHVYVCGNEDKDMGFEIVGDRIYVKPETVNSIIYAMFGELEDIPDLPEEDAGTEDGHGSPIGISNDLNYSFTLGDRGTSSCEIRNVMEFTDGSLELEEALVDSETGEEIVDFVYTMRINTRNTMTSALFGYEITGARPADKVTSDKMNGMPFLLPVVQLYGYDSYDSEDVRYNEVQEILYFCAYADNVPGMDELNARISHEIMEYANAPLDEQSWLSIISYPLTTENYVQFAVTYATYPADTGDPEIRCYNYDKKKRRAMDHNDALILCGMNDHEMTEKVVGLWRKMGGDPNDDISYRGFIVRADDSVDVFFKAGSTLIAYNSVKDELRYAARDEELIPGDETDNIKPELTHGRKGQMN
ncbi:MAG: hypothetical protein K6F73_04245 [Lachnospiraceae bacterium]|nr:hypothetical protein [Lachnospiraceae bacterium]